MISDVKHWRHRSFPMEIYNQPDVWKANIKHGDCHTSGFPDNWLPKGMYTVFTPVFAVLKGEDAPLKPDIDVRDVPLEKDMDVLSISAHETSVRCGPEPSVNGEEKERIIKEALKEAFDKGIRYIQMVTEMGTMTGGDEQYIVYVDGCTRDDIKGRKKEDGVMANNSINIEQMKISYGLLVQQSQNHSTEIGKMKDSLEESLESQRELLLEVLKENTGWEIGHIVMAVVHGMVCEAKIINFKGLDNWKSAFEKPKPVVVVRQDNGRWGISPHSPSEWRIEKKVDDVREVLTTKYDAMQFKGIAAQREFDPWHCIDVKNRDVVGTIRKAFARGRYVFFPEGGVSVGVDGMKDIVAFLAQLDEAIDNAEKVL